MLTLRTPTTHPLQGSDARRPPYNDHPRWSHTDADASVQWDGVRARWAVCDANGPVWVHPERTALPQATGWVPAATRDGGDAQTTHESFASGVQVIVATVTPPQTNEPLTEQVGGYGCCAGQCGGCWL